MEFRFQVADYIVSALIMLISVASGLYVSTVRHKQSTMMEYFVAGRNVPLVLVLLSYFSSYAAGGMTGSGIETYSFGAQLLTFVFFIPPISLFILYYFVVPVFYRMKNISMLKFFEIRFGPTVGTIVLAANVYQMTAIGTVNLFVSGLVIQQVTTLTFWQATCIMAVICFFYSTLGGMRGIVLTDSIQAVVMVVALFCICIIGVVKSGGLKAIWDINNKYDRFQSFDYDFDLTKRQTFYSVVIGQTFWCLSSLATNQTLLQRCFMAPNEKAAQKVAVIGSAMTFFYIFLYFALGLVIFAFYDGCDIVTTGKIKNFNQLVYYFAMELLYQFPGLPGIFFSGILCATLSTLSSLLNSISALIMIYFTERHPIISEKKATIACKVLVAVFGGIMLLQVLIMENFHNFNQAAITLISVISGPTFALYFIGILCPQANHKCVTISLSVSLLVGVWIILGTFMTSSSSQLMPFANCSSSLALNATVAVLSSSIDRGVYFPLSKLSHYYLSLVGILVLVFTFFILSIPFGSQKDADGKSLSQFNKTVIPHCVQVLQMKMSKRLRRLLLCDVYDDVTGDNTLLLN